MNKKEIPPEVSDYFRRLQKRGVTMRLLRTTPEERSAQAAAASRARWQKKKEEETA